MGGERLPTAQRARKIEALGLPSAEEDALLGLSYLCGPASSCTTQPANVRTLMGYGRQQGDLLLIAQAIRSLEEKALISSEKTAGGTYTRRYTLLTENWG